jgi:hypothetical protein
MLLCTKNKIMKTVWICLSRERDGCNLKPKYERKMPRARSYLDPNTLKLQILFSDPPQKTIQTFFPLSVFFMSNFYPHKLFARLNCQTRVLKVCSCTPHLYIFESYKGQYLNNK